MGIIPEEYIGRTRTTKWKSENGKNEYTVICNYPDKEHIEIINERVKTFYENRIINHLKRYTPNQQEFIIPVLKRCYELKDQGYDFDKIEEIVLKEWVDKGLVKIPDDKKGE